MSPAEPPWRNPPKSNLRWPAMLFGLFGVSVGLLMLIVGVMATFDYLDESPEVEIEEPSLLTDLNRAPRPRNAERPAEVPGVESRPATVAPREAGEPAGSATDQARAHAKSRQRTFLAQAREVWRLLDECDQELKVWSDQVMPLLENETGRKLAADPSLVRQFKAVYSQDRPSPELAGELRTALDDLAAPMKLALDDEHDVRIPQVDSVEELKRLHAEARTLRDGLRAPRQRLDALVSAARPLQPQEASLQKAIIELQNAELLAETRKIESEVAEANRMATAGKAKAAVKLVETEAQAAIEAKVAAAEKTRLIAKSKSPEVKRYLATFLAKSYFQPKGNYLSVQYERTTDDLPMSFTRIESSGALDPSVNGLRTLVVLASAGFSPPNNWHGRPPWQFDIQTFTWSKSDQEFIQKAQDLLRELGPTMVELEMLAR